jgi:CrcB protein
MVAAGGALGAAARWAVQEAAGLPGPGAIPWAVVVVNAVGSAVLAWAIAESRRRPDRASILIDFVGTGFCGGLTTFSAFALATAVQLRHGDAAWAAVSATVMLSIGLGAAVGTRVAMHRSSEVTS